MIKFNSINLFLILFVTAPAFAAPQEDALLVSANNGDSLGIRKALGANADVNAKDKDGETALIKAS
ncbi:MAG TPA: hypothetical protein VF335_09450, partial [Chitinivibrionales bacterium]